MPSLISRQEPAMMLPPGDPNAGVATNHSRIIGAAVFVIFLVTATTVARVLSRRAAKLPLKWDDWLIVFATIITIVDAALFLDAINFGFGEHIYIIAFTAPAKLVEFFKIVFATFYLYGAAIFLIKLSVLAFYHRIFPHSFKKTLYALNMITVVWFVTFVLITTFQCLPISKNWDNTVEGVCIDYLYIYIALQVWNTLLDIAIMCLPISAVIKLQLPRSKKIAVGATFGLGGLSIVFAIVRLGVLVNDRTQTDITFGTATANWSLVEPGFQIFTVSLPCLTPVLKASKVLTSWSSNFSSLFRGSSKGTSNNATNPSAQYDTKRSQGSSQSTEKDRNIYVSTETSVHRAEEV